MITIPLIPSPGKSPLCNQLELGATYNFVVGVTRNDSDSWELRLGKAIEPELPEVGGQQPTTPSSTDIEYGINCATEQTEHWGEISEMRRWCSCSQV